MRHFDLVAFVQVGNRPAEFHHPMICTGTQLHLPHRKFQYLSRLGGQHTKLLYLTRSHISVGKQARIAIETRLLTAARLTDPRPHTVWKASLQRERGRKGRTALVVRELAMFRGRWSQQFAVLRRRWG